MTNPFVAPLLALLDKRNAVDSCIRQQVSPALCEFNRLTSILLKHAATTGDVALHQWLDGMACSPKTPAF
jgi:hypothetical protein